MPLESEPVLEKDRNSAFIRTNLSKILQDKKITEIVMAGVITNISIEATARKSGNLGYKTIVASDATYTFNRTDFGGQKHTAEVVNNMSLAYLNGEYASVLSTGEVFRFVSQL